MNMPKMENTERRKPTCMRENGLNTRMMLAAAAREDRPSFLSPNAEPKLNTAVMTSDLTAGGTKSHTAT